MASLLEQASKWNADRWEHEARLADSRLSTVQQRLRQAESHQESAIQLKTQIKEQQIQHVKALQAVQYQAQQTVGDMKRQKLAQEGTWTQELDRMSAMAKACQEEGAQHALEAQSATSAVKVIQVQLDLRDLLYEKQTEGIKSDLKKLIHDAEAAVNELLEHAQSSKTEHSQQLEKLKQELMSAKAEAVGLISSQKQGYVRLQLEVQKSYYRLNTEYEKVLAQLREFEVALTQRNDSIFNLKKVLAEKSERLDDTHTKLASATESLKEVQSQLFTQTNLAACNSSKATTAVEHSFSLNNDIQRLTSQHGQLQHAFTTLQGRAQELDSRVRAMDGVSAQNVVLSARLAAEGQALAVANARIQDLEADAHRRLLQQQQDQQNGVGVVHCSVCMTGNSDYGFLHGRQMHAGYCEDCSTKISRLPEKRCPVCRVPIEAVIKIFT